MNVFLIKSAPFLVSLLIMTFYYQVKKGSAKSYSEGKTKTKGVSSFKLAMSIMQAGVPTVLFGTFALGNEVAPKLYIYTADIQTVMIGAFLSLMGSVLFILAVDALCDSYSPCFDPYLPKKLVTMGVYKSIRHPIYASNLLLVTGTFVASGSLLILIAFLILSLYYRKSMRIEEKALGEQFPNYESYKVKTGQIIPKLFKS